MPNQQLQPEHTCAQLSHKVGIWNWDVKTDRLYGDNMIARYFSVSREEIEMGAPIHKLFSAIHPADRARVKIEIARCVREKSTFQQEYRVRHVEGQYRAIVAIGHCYRDAEGNATQYPGVIFDKTDWPDPPRTAIDRLADFCMLSLKAADAVGDREIIADIRKTLVKVGFALATQLRDGATRPLEATRNGW